MICVFGVFFFSFFQHLSFVVFTNKEISSHRSVQEETYYPCRLLSFDMCVSVRRRRVSGRTGDTTGCDHDRKTNHQQLPGDHDSVRHFLSLLLSVRPIVCLFISLSVCMHQQVCVQLPTSPVNVALPAFAAARRAAAPRRPCSNQPA